MSILSWQVFRAFIKAWSLQQKVPVRSASEDSEDNQTDLFGLWDNACLLVCLYGAIQRLQRCMAGRSCGGIFAGREEL